VGSDPSLCRNARLIVSTSNQVGPVLWPDHVGEGPTVIIDLSVPPDVHPTLAAERPLTRIIRGGVIQLPANPDWYVPGIPLAPGEMYACMAETALMGLEGQRCHGSRGTLTLERVLATQEMARRHGFTSIRATDGESY
jgi:predicted amino acid dehydrogenase